MPILSCVIYDNLKTKPFDNQEKVTFDMVKKCLNIIFTE